MHADKVGHTVYLALYRVTDIFDICSLQIL